MTIGSARGLARLAPHAWPARSASTEAMPRIASSIAVIAGATAEVPLEMEGQILLRVLGEARRRHDHPGGAKAALERLGVEKRLLHRVEFAVAGKPLKRGDLAALGPECGNEATVDRLAIEPDRAGAAIPGVTPFLHAEPAEAPQQCSQALAGTRFGLECFAVDPIVHGGFLFDDVQAEEFRANLFREVMRQVLAVGRRPVHVVEVQD